MALELDHRQRAMLQEMGVQVWLPESAEVLERQALNTAPAPVAHAASGRPHTADAAAAMATRPPLPTPPADAPPRPQPAASAPAAPTVLALASTQGGVATPDWRALTQAVQSCRACPVCATRSHATLLAPSDETLPCDWLVLGDPPDEEEDRAGFPFAGQDGVLLANMLRALGLQRANPRPEAGSAGTQAPEPVLPASRRAYVSNVLKCRVHHGAMPQAAELHQCSAWLQREIALVSPKLILSIGRFANQVLLGQSPQLASLPLGKLRGTVHRYRGLPVVVSYPPKLLMRNSADKAKAWADLCLAAQTVQATPEAGGR